MNEPFREIYGVEEEDGEGKIVSFNEINAILRESVDPGVSSRYVGEFCFA